MQTVRRTFPAFHNMHTQIVPVPFPVKLRRPEKEQHLLHSGITVGGAVI